MKNIYSKTYEINSDRLESLCTLSFGENQAMITCQEFSDLNFLMDICYVEGFTKSYEVTYTYTGFDLENERLGVYVILLNKKNQKVKETKETKGED